MCHCIVTGSLNHAHLITGHVVPPLKSLVVPVVSAEATAVDPEVFGLSLCRFGLLEREKEVFGVMLRSSRIE